MVVWRGYGQSRFTRYSSLLFMYTHICFSHFAVHAYACSICSFLQSLITTKYVR